MLNRMLDAILSGVFWTGVLVGAVGLGTLLYIYRSRRFLASSTTDTPTAAPPQPLTVRPAPRPTPPRPPPTRRPLHPRPTPPLPEREQPRTTEDTTGPDTSTLVQLFTDHIVLRNLPPWLLALALLGALAWVFFRPSHTETAKDTPRPGAGFTISLDMLNFTFNHNEIRDDVFAVIKSDSPTLIPGIPGTLYHLDIPCRTCPQLCATCGPPQLLYFSPEEYRIDLVGREFTIAMAHIKEKVFKPLHEKHLQPLLFIRGKADGAVNDHVSFRNPQHRLIGMTSQNVYYLLRDPDQMHYRREWGVDVIPAGYTNLHLPNLRAWFIQDFIEHNSTAEDHIPKPIMLDGCVTTNRTLESDRHVELLLCIHWKGKPDTDLLKLLPPQTTPAQRAIERAPKCL